MISIGIADSSGRAEVMLCDGSVLRSMDVKTFTARIAPKGVRDEEPEKVTKWNL
jgi:hypothetical protein